MYNLILNYLFTNSTAQRVNELKDEFTIQQMAAFHKQLYPYSFNLKAFKEKFKDFSEADYDFNPVCLRGAHWEIVKLDILDLSQQLMI